MAHFAGLVAGKAIPCPCCSATSFRPRRTRRCAGQGWAHPRTRSARQSHRQVCIPRPAGGPTTTTVAAKAVAFGEALRPSFARYEADDPNAQTIAEVMTSRGLRCVSGGTDTHLVLVDLTNFGVTGKAASDALEHAGITVNMNMVPYDTRKPVETSGIRIGSPASTSRGMKESHMRTIANWIADVVKDPSDEAMVKRVRGAVGELAQTFPLRAESE